MKYGAELIKFCATGGVLSARDAVGVQPYTLEEMSAIVEAAALADARVAAHAHGLEGIKTAGRAGVSSIEHGSTLDEGLLAPWSARKTREIAPHFQRSIRLAITEEVNIAFGTVEPGKKADLVAGVVYKSDAVSRI